MYLCMKNILGYKKGRISDEWRKNGLVKKWSGDTFLAKNVSEIVCTNI